jgi:hypothetical protein
MKKTFEENKIVDSWPKWKKDVLGVTSMKGTDMKDQEVFLAADADGMWVILSCGESPLEYYDGCWYAPARNLPDCISCHRKTFKKLFPGVKLPKKGTCVTRMLSDVVGFPESTQA